MSEPTPKLRRNDGSLWEASYKSVQDAMASLFDRDAPKFYFRKLALNERRKWWCPWRPTYVRTGEVWEGSDLRSAGFEIIKIDAA